MGIDVLSLFDGMSCGQIALDKLGVKVNNYYASEIKQKGIDVTQENYPNTKQLGSVTDINGGDFKGIDLLIGGSPCQNLSLAMAKKHRKGLEGDKSSLFYEYYRILKEANPRYFLLENVGGMNEKDKNIITELLGVEPIKINSKLVSGQLRNRLYWTNIKGVNQPKDKEISLSDILDSGYTEREKARCLLESDSRPLANPVKMFHRYQKFNTLVFKDQSHYIGCRNHYANNFKGKSAKEIDLFDGDLSVYNGVRYLNQNEVEKLQTVPLGYTKSLNRNDATGLMGDGWTVDVIVHILSFADFK